MMILAEHTIERLIQIEAGIHYAELPPPGRMPFVVVRRASPIILSAPHGALTFRNNGNEVWHEEDEYTAGMALLLSELCGTSVIATIWRTEDSDPNEHGEEFSAYKQEVRRMVESTQTRWFVDLHGAGEDSPRLFVEQKVDLGTGNKKKYLPSKAYESLANYEQTGIGTTNTVGCFPGGASIYGAEETSGNVCEWVKGDSNNLCGGSFSFIKFWNVRCAFRSWNGPYFRGDNFGFRLVVSPNASLPLNSGYSEFWHSEER